MLSGNNSYSGGTTIYAGTLMLGNAAALGGGTVAVNSGAALDLNGNAVSGANALTLSGSGVSNGGALLNSNANAATYAGQITLGNDSLIIASNGDISLSSASGIGGSGNDLTVGGANDTTIAGPIATGSGMLTKQDAGMLTLTGVCTYTGSTTITGGTLALSGAGNLGGSKANYTGNIANSGALLINTSTGNNQTFGGIISGTGSLYQAGNALTALTANNTYSGSTTISAGTLAIGSSLAANNGNNYTAPIVNNGSLLFNSSTNQFLSGSISGSGNLTQNGNSVLSLNATNTFSGITLVGGGTLSVLTPAALQMSTLDTSGAGYVDFSTLSSGTLGGLQGNNNLVLGSGTWALGPLAVGNNNTSTTFSGDLVGNGNCRFTKVGSGTLTLTGSSNSYGDTNIKAGTLVIAGSGSLGNGGNYYGNITDKTALVINTSSNQSFTGTIHADGTVTQNGPGLLFVGNAQNYFGDGTIVAGGTLQIGAINALGQGGLTVNGGVIDLNGNALIIANSNALPWLSGTGGTITDSSVAAGGPTILTVNQSSSTTFAGSIQTGPNGRTIQLLKSSGGGLTLSVPASRRAGPRSPTAARWPSPPEAA